MDDPLKDYSRNFVVRCAGWVSRRTRYGGYIRDKVSEIPERDGLRLARQRPRCPPLQRGFAFSVWGLGFGVWGLGFMGKFSRSLPRGSVVQCLRFRD